MRSILNFLTILVSVIVPAAILVLPVAIYTSAFGIPIVPIGGWTLFVAVVISLLIAITPFDDGSPS